LQHVAAYSGLLIAHLVVVVVVVIVVSSIRGSQMQLKGFWK
jgi:hypothetical protein